MAAAHKSAALVQEILRMGAVIVGKTKTSQLDAGNDWVDVSAPWNPRADGYQAPGGVSAGASAAISTYNWLEYSIGTDRMRFHSNGHGTSLTCPTEVDGALQNAALQGLYALRPSKNASADRSLKNGTPFVARALSLVLMLT